MIDYSPAKHWAKYVRALAIIESDEDEFKPGDGGRAFGLLQMHPDRYNDEVRYTAESALAQYAVNVGDTWTTAQIKICASYFERHVGVALMLIVMAWRLGVAAVFELGERDEEYWHRWQAAFERIT